MAGKPSEAVRDAMVLVLRGAVPYQAARHYNIALSTMYRSRLYIMWKGGKFDELKIELGMSDAEHSVEKST